MTGSEQWKLRLLGGFQLSREGRASDIPLGSKERALLAYLVLHSNRRESRQKLATLLWGNIGEESARHSLSECLSKLRKAHEDQEQRIFATQGDYVVVDPASFRVDAVDFAELAKKADRESLEKAEALYAGELLDGLDVRTQGFEDWLRDERARLEELTMTCLSRLMGMRTAAGTLSEAIATADRILKLDEINEAAHRTKMRAAVQLGNRSAAIKAAERCELSLREAKIQPEPETQQVIRDVRSASELLRAAESEPAPGGTREGVAAELAAFGATVPPTNAGDTATAGVTRRLAAILTADVVGYSRLMGQDEAGTLAALKERRKEVVDPLIGRHQGRIVKISGDGVLAEFASAVNAVTCAVELQDCMATANEGSPKERRIVLRIGINLGDVIVDGGDLYGDGVNIAARLEALADPGGILISGTAHDYVRNKVKVGFDDLGAQNLKNIVDAVRVYRVADTRQLLPAFQQTGEQTAETLARAAAPSTAGSQARAAPSLGLAHGRHSVRRLIHWLIGTIVVSALVAVAGIVTISINWWRIPELAPAPIGEIIRLFKDPIRGEPPSIAVLPFRGFGDDPTWADNYGYTLASGITDALKKASEMVVKSQITARVFEDQPATASQIAERLKARYLLDGSVQRWGDRVTVQVGLTDTEAGEHLLWSESFEGPAGEFSSLVPSITLDVITALEVQLTAGETSAINLAHGTRNLDAWLTAAEAYKLLRHLNPDDNRKARALYLNAIQLDPNYSGAWEGLAWTYFIEARFGWGPSPERSAGEAARLAQEVLKLDDTRPRAYSLLGGIELLNRNYHRAVELGEKAVELEPNDADAAFLLGYTLTFTGEPQRAMALINRAIDRTPYPPGLYHLVLGRANRLAGFHKAAERILEQVVAADSSSYIPLVELAATYAVLGKSGKAREAAETVMRLNPDFKVGVWVQIPAFRDNATTVHEVEILRSVGLPE